ncbi:hypothetical protein Pcinc_027201 [Petrolisthes cinctipes]|uniref:Uncharacterized protein n=1 Tax=Petrolisthes cinctipes TaxID=88211 RepID=A0AAE1F4F0_PETCI|nr:hypothetical protein Pcinc_027201 [Petrolisthes cinctipes]
MHIAYTEARSTKINVGVSGRSGLVVGVSRQFQEMPTQQSDRSFLPQFPAQVMLMPTPPAPPSPQTTLKSPRASSDPHLPPRSTYTFARLYLPPSRPPPSLVISFLPPEFTFWFPRVLPCLS